MLKKGAAAAMGRGDPQAPSPRPSTKATDGGRPASLLLSTRSLPSLFSPDSPMSPTSVPERSKNPPCPGARTGRSGAPYCGGVGGPAAGLAGVLVAEETDRGCRESSGRVLLGMRLRVQLPPPPGKSPGGADLPGSPIEFGVKNRDAQLALLSPVQRSPLSSAAARLARRSEVEELAEEDYTCVIARGPNPRMTHIFEDRVVESRAGAGAAGDGRCLPSSCSGCKKDALLLRRSERDFCNSQYHYEEVLFGKRGDDSPDALVKLKP
ncbi:hypothetical protein BS78_02G048700 [Paspalum vaginatum]|nr:hypothetical protein BS78_02G048700 [Paspalum vaginatum]KAJ1287931.1 hypothetical protein BS78_02G048700 [Paspalum vaginatum]